MHHTADEFTLIEGGKEHAFSATAARTAGGLLVSAGSGKGIGIVWPQILGVIPSGPDTLAIVASFCLVTLYGAGVASLARTILDRRISELREGLQIDGARIDKITIEGNLPKLGNQECYTGNAGGQVELRNTFNNIGVFQGAAVASLV